jgi:hypothetical protein
VIDYFGQWLKRPWSSDMDLTGWVLFIVLVVTVALAWRGVLTYIVDAAE